MEVNADGLTQLLIKWRNGDKAALDHMRPGKYLSRAAPQPRF